jgi:hypothetical protein
VRLATGSLRVSLHGIALNRGAEEAVGHIMAGSTELGVHADVQMELARSATWESE